MAKRTAPPIKYPTAPRGDEHIDAGGAEPRGGDDGHEDLPEEGAPEGFKSETEFVQFWAKTYTEDLAADKHNIDEGMEDLRFIYVDQWDPDTRAEREDAGRPCITVNTLPQFIGQVVGDRRLNKTSLKVIPQHTATVKGAEVRSGLLKSIENHSRAERVYDACCEDQVGCGISNFKIVMDYARNDVFEQDLFVRGLSNPFAVVWDRFSLDITGRDAKHCFEEETISREQYTKEYPDKPIPTAYAGEHSFGEDQDQDDVKLVALWRMIERPAKFALMQDGQVEDVTDVPEEEYMGRLHVDDDGVGYVKDGVRTYAQRWLLTSFAILDGPYELPLSRLPIIKVSGRVGRVGTKRYRFGLVRWAREPSLMRNYWRSIAVETLAMAPRSQWIADHASVKGREDDFRDAHLTGDPLLVYNTGKNKPDRIDPPALPTAVLMQSEMNTQDIKDVTGLHDASLGIRSNEVSGRAIQARQREGDVATITFHDNLNESIREGGCVMNELIPICYDTTRTIRVIGAEDVAEFVKINDPYDEESPDITYGRYDTEIITGPSFTTQRQEGAELMLELAKVNPALFEIAGDILMETQDIPGGQRIADRLKKVLPAAQQEEAEKQAKAAAVSGQPPQEDPAMQAAQAMQQMQMEVAQAEMQAQLAEMQARVAEAEANAAEAAARARKAEMELDLTEEKIRKAAADAEKSEAVALQAHDDVERAEEAHEQTMRSNVINLEQQHRHKEVGAMVDTHRKLNPPEGSGASKQSGGGSRSAGASRPKKGTRK